MRLPDASDGLFWSAAVVALITGVASRFGFGAVLTSSIVLAFITAQVTVFLGALISVKRENKATK